MRCASLRAPQIGPGRASFVKARQETRGVEFRSVRHWPVVRLIECASRGNAVVGKTLVGFARPARPDRFRRAAVWSDQRGLNGGEADARPYAHVRTPPPAAVTHAASIEERRPIFNVARPAAKPLYPPLPSPTRLER